MKIEQGKYGYCKLKYLPWLHYIGLKYSYIVLLMKQQEKIGLFHVLLTVTLFPKRIQSHFSLTLQFKAIGIAIAVVNYIMQYQLNFSYIEEIKFTS